MSRQYQNNFENYLIVQRVAEKTKKSYLQAVHELEAFQNQPADKLNNEQIQEYLIYCIQEKELAWSSCNVLFCALKKYYSGYLGRDESKLSIPPRPRSRQLPMLLSPDEVKSILLATGNLKHKSLLALIYGSGLRVSEAVNLDPHHEEQHKVMGAIEACRTARLGGHMDVCDNCGATQNSYNSCRNRHCPKCQTMTKEDWLASRKRELLPCGYFHLVFTLPHILNPLILSNRKELLNLLFLSVNSTLKTFAADPQWHLEEVPGILTLLHTWSQTLIDHFHLHCLIPAGALKK